MTGAAERTRREGQELARRLIAEKRPQDAAIVSRLVKSSGVLSGNLAVLWQDNRELRAQLREADSEHGA